MTGIPTTQQRRAKHAWETVAAARARFTGEAAWAEFVGHVKRLGPRIVTAGLGPAIAFLKEKTAKDPFLLQRLDDWVLREPGAQATTHQLIARIRDGNSDDLRHWTADSVEWVVWVKRFCGAENGHE